MTPLVSLILVTYNDAQLLPAYFEHLRATTYRSYELIVVDNASADGTLAYLNDNEPDVKTISNEVGVGFGRAANQGAAIAAGDLLVFMNADVFVTPDWLDRLVAHMARHADAGILSPTVLPPALAERPVGSGTVETAAVPGCSMMVRRSAWSELAGFDPTYYLYWEDTDLCWRAWLRGWRVLEALDAKVVHLEGGSGGGKRWAEEEMRNAIYTHLKNLRWRKAAPALAGLALETIVAMTVQRRPAVGRAWIWNARHLGSTLATRRRAQADSIGDRGALERLISAHRRRQIRERVGTWRASTSR
jgi:N-acetylglucosaminyl-diphospho-decaprenol L-rhamnosyltransferase